MKFAVFGDIHGNIEALKAAYEAAQAAGAEKIYHLGDLGGYSPFVNEVVDFLLEHGIEGVQGNYDETVAKNAEHCGARPRPGAGGDGEPVFCMDEGACI
jgi:predicted phosphodiesterase